VHQEPNFKTDRKINFDDINQYENIVFPKSFNKSNLFMNQRHTLNP